MNENTTHYSGFLSPEHADTLFRELLTQTPWHKWIKTSTGREQKLKRRMAYMYSREVEYKYGQFVLPGMLITPIIQTTIDLIKVRFGLNFNSVLLNCYDNGKDSINWHSDKEDQLGPNPIIGSLNLGATRKFHFMRKTNGEKMHVELAHGDFFVMDENCQPNWLHAILPEPEITTPRISLTFRWVYDDKFDQLEGQATTS